MRILDCSMCGAPMYPGHGSTFVRNDAKVFRYCSKKCRKLFVRKVNPRRLRYSKAYRRTHNKELSMDTTFDFEKVRNRPPKYDRELYASTIAAIKRVNSIQYKRQRSFYFNRMRSSMKIRKMAVQREIKTNLSLAINPVAVPKLLADKIRMNSNSILTQELKLQAGTTNSVVVRRDQPEGSDSDEDSDVEVE
ncbi:ribosomal protein L24 [Acrasis kona]|uniref:Ribosomal protein L24 n=1 Tax=Acrasis kona TaxID=1008807 RepID=A0AAW2Z2W5_9EUKA